MEKRSSFAGGPYKRALAVVLMLALFLCSLTACSRKSSETGSSETKQSEDAEAGAIDGTDLPEGASFAGAAIPTTPLAFPVSEEKTAGKQIQNADEAKAFLQDLQEEIGFSDISEFSDAASDDNELFNVYRFTQMVGDLPVESRGISLLTDSEGRVIEMSGKYLDPAEIDSEVRITSGEACEAVRAELPAEKIRQIGGGCVIYAAGEKAQAAWKNLVFADGDIFECYVSASDGDVLAIHNLAWNDTSIGTGTDDEGVKVSFHTVNEDNHYLLEDPDTHIRIYDFDSKDPEWTVCVRSDFLEGETFVAVLDENDDWMPEGNLGFSVTRMNHEMDPGHDYRMIFTNRKEMAITDNGTVLYPDVHVELLFPIESEENSYYEVLRDEDNVWENERAVSVMNRLQDVVLYWRAVLGRNSYDDSDNPLVVGLNANVSNAATCVAEVLSGYNSAAGVIRISPTFPVNWNVLAHEFTHAVIQSRVQLGYGYTYADASAINEGLADLFSELTEYYLTGSCDWIAKGDKERNIKNPSASTIPQPSVYQGEHWHYGLTHHKKADIDNYDTYAYQNLSLISHMGYLIVNGDLVKSEHTEGLGMEMTAKLFYNTFPRLNIDTTFSEYAGILYRTAVEMFKKDQLNAEQVRCVYRAMEEVGLLPVFEVFADGTLSLKTLNDLELTGCSIDIYSVDHIRINDRVRDVIYDSSEYHTHTDVKVRSEYELTLPNPPKNQIGAVYYKFVIHNNMDESEDFSFLLHARKNLLDSFIIKHIIGLFEQSIVVPFVYKSDEDRYYTYLKDTYGTEESDLVSAYIMDFDLDGRKDLLTVTKGRVILANTPLGAFDLYDGETEAATLDLTMYQLDEENKVVKTGAILGAGTIEGHSEGKMSVSIVLQDGKPYICGYSENEDNTTYGARPYVIYEVIEGGGFQYDYVDGISWGQYVMGTTDNKDPNKVAKTYGLDITGTQLSDRANYGVVLCEATANNRQGPGPIVANDYTGVKEGMENGYEAVKNQLDAIHELMVLDADTFKERQESAKDTEGLFEIFANELSAAGITPVLKEYRTKEDIVLGVYKCQDVDMYVSIENGSGKLTEIELLADGFPVPDSWYLVKDAVLTSSFAGLDQTKIGEVLGHTPANFSVYGLDAGPAKILAGNTDTIVLRISY